jgi:hypothetical protein
VPTDADRGALPHSHEAKLPIIHYSFFIIHYSLSPLVFALLHLLQGFVPTDAGRGALPHTPQTF